MRGADPAELIGAARDGDRRALARLLSLVERGGSDARSVARLAHPLSGDVATVGITGAPGSGKSTLTNALVRAMRREGLQVSILAIDPSSPFSGGAILGDRVRMGDHALDEGVFIRSMATRGHLGGLTLAAPEAIRVLDAVGADWVMIETVGVGQVEVEVAGAADTTVVVVNPGWGDAVQANKAGLLEIADLFVVNKADRAGVDDTRRDLQQMLDLTDSGTGEGWRPPILDTVASGGAGNDGVDELWAAIGEHRAWLAEQGRLERKRAQRRREELGRIVTGRLRRKAEGLLGDDGVAALEDEVAAGAKDPWAAADELLGPLDA